MPRVSDLVAAHEAWRARECLNLQPSENVMSPAARRLLDSDLANRYTLPWKADYHGAYLENAYRGTRYTDAIEARAESLARDVFDAAHASAKPLSGHIAGAMLLTSTVERGDTIMVVNAAHGGYDGYLPDFLPGMLGLRVSFLPFVEAEWNLDHGAATEAILRVRPKLVLVGASFLLFPYNLRWLRGVCDDVNAVLAYDGSHVLGLIAGGRFQRPLTEGADVLIGSTHKSFPGPQGGLFLANRKEVFDRALSSYLWRLMDNVHWNRIAATAYVLEEMKAFGAAYAEQVVRNTQALGRALHDGGFPLRFAALGYSKSHQLLIDEAGLKESFGLTPNDWAVRLEASNVIVDAVSRIGTNEVTRMGATETDMRDIAALLVRAARGEDVKEEVRGVRSRLHLSYTLEGDD